MRRRTLPFALAVATLALALIALAGCGRKPGRGADGRRVIVLGFDGLDYELTRRLIDEGRLPNFARLEATGGPLQPLGTSIPPQSPVAWSNFLTGSDAGVHGIYDFVHRDPKTMEPYLSTSRVVEPENPREPLAAGNCRLPLSSGQMELLRRGTPIWERLEEHGIETTVLRMPANFPPSGSASYELSGMGTPDILGTYGTFTFYTSELFYDASKISGGGEAVEAWPEDGVVTSDLLGPDNPFVAGKVRTRAPFSVYLDPDEPVARLVVGDEERLLAVGEWTDWVPVSLDLGLCGRLVMNPAIPAMARFYLKSVRPEFELYVSPLNLDPMQPVMPISTPADYAARLAAATGRFYTQGMPEDTKAVEGGVLDRAVFMDLVHHTLGELVTQYRQVLADWQGGLLFYYFGSVDQASHVMWDTLDPGHPRYDPEESPRFADAIPELYAVLDEVAGYTLDHLPPDTTVIVMSDHGFTSWRRVFHLNTWLLDHGYLAVHDRQRALAVDYFGDVDWSRTRAYGLGINALYLNVRGREKDGIVAPEERASLMREIADGLLATIDPATGRPAISNVFLREESYAHGSALEIGPDLVIGYAKGTRCSGASALGEFAPEVFGDNLDDWAGEHLMDPAAVP
ncbi:MAG TPA: alkaline phosphatase family protein, partial [Thermoanaerobaculia bacterium]|nr:alkaline phosphatase family protein [Thermoanaerobaculia bacterium]